MSNIKYLNVHVSEDLLSKVQEICSIRKAKGQPNSTMRFVIIELLERGLEYADKQITTTKPT